MTLTKTFWIGLVLMGSLYANVEGGATCVTPTNTAAMSGYVGQVIVIVTPFVTADPTVNSTTLDLLTAALCDAENKDVLASLAEGLKACPELLQIPETNLNMLALGPQSILDLVNMYTDTDEYCRCRPAQTCAPALKSVNLWFLSKGIPSVEGDSATTFSANIPVLCSVEAHLKCVEDVYDSCPRAVSDSGIQNMTTLLKLRGLAMTQCAAYNNLNDPAGDWACAIGQDGERDLRHCVDYAMAQADGKNECGVRRCITRYIGNRCNPEVVDVYIAARKPYNDIDLTMTCSSPAISFSAILLGLIALLNIAI